MRFLIFTQYFSPEIGATQTRLLAVAESLVEAGHSVEVVTSMPNYPEGRIQDGYRGRLWLTEEIAGIHVSRVCLYPAMGSGVKRIINYLSFMVTGTFGLMAARRPDYVYVESPPPTLTIPGIIIARLRRSKVIVNVADLWPDSVVDLGIMHEGRTVRAIRWLERWSYRHADFITAVTEGISARITARAPGKRVLFLPNGVDTTFFAPRPRSGVALSGFGVPSNVPVVMYAGTMGYAQGLDTALRAAGILAARKVPLHFVFVGDGSEREALQHGARTRRLENVTFIRPVPQEKIAEMWSGADIGYASLIDIPLFEGARPSKLLPAMACGKPVVYGGRGEIADLILQASAGLVVPPGDADALAEALVGLARDVELQRTLGDNGRAFVQSHLTWPALVSDWLDQLALD